MLHIQNGQLAHMYSDPSLLKENILVVNTDVLEQIGYSKDEISSLLERETAGYVEHPFLVPPEAVRYIPNATNLKNISEPRTDKVLRLVSNAISEIDAICENGMDISTVRPCVKEAWNKLHAAQEEYIKLAEAQLNHSHEHAHDNNRFLSLNFIGQTLKEAGDEIKALFNGLIKRDFDWCEACAPHANPGGVDIYHDDFIRSYVTKGCQDGYLVNVEAFVNGDDGRQLFKAKTANINVANALSSMISSLINDKLSNQEIDRINTIGVKTETPLQSGFATFASKNHGDTSLEKIVLAMNKKYSVGPEV